MNNTDRDHLAAYWRNRPPRYYKGSRIESVDSCILGDGIYLMRLQTARGTAYTVFGYEPYKFHFFDSYGEASDYIARRGIAARDPNVEVLPPDKAVRVSATPYDEPSEVRFFDSYLEAAAHCAKMEPAFADLPPHKKFCTVVVFGWCQRQFEVLHGYEEAFQFCLGMTEEAVCGVRNGTENLSQI